jgi:hypothetical protein
MALNHHTEEEYGFIDILTLRILSYIQYQNALSAFRKLFLDGLH